MSDNEIIPSAWQPLIQIVGFIAVFVTILYQAVRLTRYITKVEDRITIESTELEGKITNEATRLDGRINQLEDRINDVKNELHIQRNELQRYFANNAEIMLKIGEMIGRGENNVKSHRTRKEED